VVPSGLPDGPWRTADCFGRKSIEKVVSDIGRMENTPIHVCAKVPLLVGHQQKVGELILSITPCPAIIILRNTFN
jgi:hypothetical protein